MRAIDRSSPSRTVQKFRMAALSRQQSCQINGCALMFGIDHEGVRQGGFGGRRLARARTGGAQEEVQVGLTGAVTRQRCQKFARLGKTALVHQCRRRLCDGGGLRRQLGR